MESKSPLGATSYKRKVGEAPRFARLKTAQTETVRLHDLAENRLILARFDRAALSAARIEESMGATCSEATDRQLPAGHCSRLSIQKR